MANENEMMEQGYSHTAHLREMPPTRRARVRVSVVARTCATCGRVALDVRAPWRGEGALCSSGVGCQGRADRAAKAVSR